MVQCGTRVHCSTSCVLVSSASFATSFCCTVCTCSFTFRINSFCSSLRRRDSRRLRACTPARVTVQCVKATHEVTRGHTHCDCSTFFLEKQCVYTVDLCLCVFVSLAAVPAEGRRVNLSTPVRENLDPSPVAASPSHRPLQQHRVSTAPSTRWGPRRSDIPGSSCIRSCTRSRSISRTSDTSILRSRRGVVFVRLLSVLKHYPNKGVSNTGLSPLPVSMGQRL